MTSPTSRPNPPKPSSKPSPGQVSERVEALVSTWVAPGIREMAAYHTPAAEGGVVKLDAMESPYQLPAELRREWLARLGEVAVNRYPDAQCVALKRQIRATFGLAEGSGLVLGNGSDELIQMLILLLGRGAVILAPRPTFAMYGVISAAVGACFIGVPLLAPMDNLGADFALDVDAMLAAIRRHRPAAVFLAYPNNPSGNCFDESAMRAIIRQAPGLVVVDEAYFAFCRRSFMDEIGDFPNLMVLRTLSKSGMAALRLGLLAGHPTWCAQLEKIRLPYNISSLTQASARFYLENHGVLQRHADAIIAQRQVLLAQLAARRGVRAYPSAANFILFRTAADAAGVHRRLIARGILIKNLHATDAALSNCLRVTIGNEAENQQFLAALDAALESAPESAPESSI